MDRPMRHGSMNVSPSVDNILDLTLDVPSNIGTYLARRMVELGVKDYFVVPGDFNLILLDQILLFPQLQMISCCNELNAGYAADGYARVKGVAFVFVTFTVGGLAAINAIAGAFSDDLPVIIISGGLNSNDLNSNRIIHHTTGLPYRNQVRQCFKQVCARAETIIHPSTAPEMLDDCILTALKTRKPVYIEIACNIVKHHVHAPVPFGRQLAELSPSDKANQAAAVDAVVDLFSSRVKPVIIVGPKVRMFRTKNYVKALVKLAEASGCAVAVQPAAKGQFPESHPNYIGTYWGSVSHEFTCETVESCDLMICIGTVWTDYSTVGYSLHMPAEKRVDVDPFRVKCESGEFSFINLVDFVEALAEVVPKNGTSLKVFNHMQLGPRGLPERDPNGPLESRVMAHHVQELLSDKTALICETGDSWFHGQKMKLPDGCNYEFQMQYGSIGWSVGAVLGYALALQGKKRVIAMIGDGSFQCTAQEVSTMIRYNTNPIIFLANNDGYTIEVEIHDGIYNNIQRWKYAGLIDVFNGYSDANSGNKAANGWSTVVRTESELLEAIEYAKGHDGVCLIECILDRDDCTKELLEWGTRVAAANGRKYQEF